MHALIHWRPEEIKLVDTRTTLHLQVFFLLWFENTETENPVPYSRHTKETSPSDIKLQNRHWLRIKTAPVCQQRGVDEQSVTPPERVQIHLRPQTDPVSHQDEQHSNSEPLHHHNTKSRDSSHQMKASKTWIKQRSPDVAVLSAPPSAALKLTDWRYIWLFFTWVSGLFPVFMLS